MATNKLGPGSTAIQCVCRTIGGICFIAISKRHGTLKKGIRKNRANLMMKLTGFARGDAQIYPKTYHQNEKKKTKKQEIANFIGSRLGPFRAL